MRQHNGRLVNAPVFGSRKLQDQNLMRVVVRRESARIARGQISVSVHHVIELLLDTPTQMAVREPL